MRALITTLLSIFLSLWQAVQPAQAATDNWAELASQSRMQTRLHKSEEGLRLAKLALQQAEQFGEQDPRLTASLRLVGTFELCELGHPAYAVPYFEREQAILKRQLGPNFPGLCSGMFSLALCYICSHEYERAENLLLRAWEIHPASIGVARDYNFEIPFNLGKLYKSWNKLPLAEKYFVQAYNLKLKLGGKLSEMETRDVCWELGELYNMTGRYKEALAKFNEALALCERNTTWDKPGFHLGHTQYQLGNTYQFLGQLDEATKWYKLAISKEKLDPGNWGITLYSYYSGLVQIEQKRGNYQAAAEYARLALPIAEKHDQSAAKSIRQFLANQPK